LTNDLLKIYKVSNFTFLEGPLANISCFSVKAHPLFKGKEIIAS